MVAEVYKINYHMKRYTKNEEMKQLLLATGFQAVEIHENNKWRGYVGYK
jgi:hypothetical protein